MRLRTAIISSFVVGVSIVVGAQQRQPVQPLLDEHGEVKEERYLPAPLPASEQQYAGFNGARMKATMNEIVAISRKSRDDGNKYWGRIAGTKYEAMTADLLEQKFRKLGMVDINRPSFDLRPQWYPLDWNFTATAAGKTLTFKTLLPALGSGATPVAGLDLEAIWVGLGTAADFKGRDVRGKAVVVQSMLSPGQMGMSANFENVFPRAREAGAAAIVAIWGYHDNMAVWQGMSGGSTANNASASESVPGFWLGFEDGKVLRDAIAAGTVRIKANLKTEMRSGLKTESIWGTLRGTTDENVIVMAHMDGWFDAALDNASGIAVMLALAEHYAAIPQERRRRNMIFIGTAGHHVGSPNAAYLRDKRADLVAKTALMINCEHVAPVQTMPWETELRRSTAVEPRRWWVHGSSRLMDITLNAYRTFGVAIAGDMDDRATGEMGQVSRNAPSIQVIESPQHKHTDMDIMSLVPAAGLEQITRAYAKIIDEVNKLDRSALLPAAPATSSARAR